MAEERPPRKKLRGRLIVLEGIDGVGKSTIAKAACGELEARGIPVQMHAFPGNDPGTLGHHVYRIHHGPLGDSLPASTLQMLHVAAHVDAIENRLRPAIQRGTWVILDRYWWSTWVYGLVSGVPRTALASMLAVEKEHWGPLQPDALVLVKRTLREAQESVRHIERQREYDLLAEAERCRVQIDIVDNDDSVKDAVQKVVNIALRYGRHSAGAPKEAKQEHEAHRQLRLGFSSQGPGSGSPLVLASIAPAKPTVVFDTYWRFAAERQRVFFRRLRGETPPWTDDPILLIHKFTNAYRASDRVSQYLISNVIYDGDPSAQEVFFRTMLFKTFNKIETWEALLEALGNVAYAQYSFSTYDRALTNIRDRGASLYSGAYIMPSGNRAFGFSRKHQNHLKLIERMMEDAVPDRLTEIATMSNAFELLKSYPMIGDFLAYQYVTDLNYSRLTNFTEMDFVVPGPGARDGIRKCFSDLGGLTEPEIIRLMADRQEAEFERLGIDFMSLWGRRLQLIDCQNLFCEVDKFARLAHPEIRGISGRSRIKQRFQANSAPVTYWYPPKWGINDRVIMERSQRS